MDTSTTPEVQEKLNSLEKILSEFYDANTDLSRKQELEKVFEDFSNDPYVWKHIRDFVKFSSNFYVLHFSLMVTENTLKLHGVCTESELWTELKSLLQSRVLSMEGAPSYLIHKIIKINAHIARVDWPHFYPDYFPNIFKLLQSGSSDYHVILGAKYLQITSQEFLSPREDISFARKTELKRFLTSRVLPDIFILLLRGLEVWKSNLRIISSLLETFEQYFSWVPLDSVYSVALINSICQFMPKLEVGVRALTCLNEILYKALVPVTCLPLLSHVISHSFTLVHHVASLPLHNIPEDYLSKVTENVRLVVSNHWHRVESLPDLNPGEFLSDLLQYTWQSRPARENLYECLAVWGNLVDQLTSHKEQQLVQYKAIMSSLLSKLLEEIQASSSLDDEELNEDNRTEKQECLDHCNDVVVKIMQLFPQETLNLVLSYWVPASLTYAEFLARHSTPHSNLITPESLSAMCNYTQVLTRIHQCTEARRSDLVHTLSQMALDSTCSLLFCKPDYQNVSLLLIQVQCEILASLKCWLASCSEEVTSDTLYNATLPLILDKTVPSRLCHAAVHLLATTILQRPTCDLTTLESLTIPNALVHLPLESRVVLESALIKSVLSKPLPSPSEDRPSLLQSLINILVRTSTVECYHLSLLLPHCQLTSKLSKQTLSSVLEPWLSQVILEYPRHLDKHNYRLCGDMVAFYLEAFRILQDQMPLSLLQQAAQVFIDQRLQTSVTPEIQPILDKLFQLLQVIIEQPSSQFKLFVPSSLDLCTRIIHLDSPHVPKSNAYNLLAIILSEKWQFFFRGQHPPDTEALSHLCNILTCLGHACSSEDISLVGQTLRALEALHARWRLYDKEVFRERFLASFLTTFLCLLIENQHSLLSEDLTQALFHLAQVDMAAFYQQYLPGFLLQLSGLTDSQRHLLHTQLTPHTDFSTFSQNITQLANDVRCFRKFTRSIPPTTS